MDVQKYCDLRIDMLKSITNGLKDYQAMMLKDVDGSALERLCLRYEGMQEAFEEIKREFANEH